MTGLQIRSNKPQSAGPGPPGELSWG